MKNMKTTLAGLAAGIPMAIDAIMEAYKAGAFEGKTGWQLAIAIAIILLGVASADAKKK